MSSPNTPDDNKPPAGERGPNGAHGSGAPEPGKVPPPWQRGSGEGNHSQSPQANNGRDVEKGSRPGPPPRGIVSATGPTAAASMSGQQAPVTKLDDPAPGSGGHKAPPPPPGRPGPGKPPGPGRPPGPGTPPGPGAPTAAPGPGKPPPGPGKPPEAGKKERFVESPTHNIDRKDLPGRQLPNLDAIHHVDEQTPRSQGASRSAPTAVGSNRPLRAPVQIRRFDPWAAFKIAGVLSIAGFLIWMVAVAVLYLVLDGMGVWDQVNSSFGTLVTANGSSSQGNIIGAGAVFGWAALLGVINAILLTALTTLGAYIYNLCADLIGGVEVTLADLD